MDIHASLRGAKELQAKIAGYRARLKDLKPAFLRAGTVTLRAAQQRFRTKGGGSWPPAKRDPKNRSGQTIGTLMFRTGHLFRSLEVGADDNLVQEITGGIRVGTNVKSKKGKPYPIYLQKGAPKRNLPARPFLFFDERLVDGVTKVFANYLWRAERGE